MEFRVLGPLEAVSGGEQVVLGGPRQRAVLALLLLRANTVVARDRLVDELWPTEPPPSAVNVVQTYVSHLRKSLGPDRLVGRPPGYLLRVEPGELDLDRFEELLVAGRRALAGADAATAAEALRQALALWRGPALGDVAAAGLARAEAARLEELRLSALEDRVEADLELGRHAELVGELEAVVAGEPLRERLLAQLMLALYRAGRQPEALAAYRDFRKRIGDELGIVPGTALRDLESAILRQDAMLEGPAAAPLRPGAGGRAVLVACLDEATLGTVLDVAVPLVRERDDELVLVRLVRDAQALGGAAAVVRDRRLALAEAEVRVRAAAFTSADVAADVGRLAADSHVALLLVDAEGQLDASGALGGELHGIVAEAACDVAALVGGGAAAAPAGGPVLVPFGGSEHEWAAAEIGAWMAKAHGLPLRLAGTEADDGAGRRDASRLLASVSLLVQRVAAVDAEPALGPPGPDSLVALAGEASVVLLGLPDGWRDRGLGATRARVAAESATPTFVVRGGVRPGGLAPPEGLTRFTWTITGRTR